MEIKFIMTTLVLILFFSIYGIIKDDYAAAIGRIIGVVIASFLIITIKYIGG